MQLVVPSGQVWMAPGFSKRKLAISGFIKFKNTTERSKIPIPHATLTSIPRALDRLAGAFPENINKIIFPIVGAYSKSLLHRLEFNPSMQFKSKNPPGTGAGIAGKFVLKIMFGDSAAYTKVVGNSTKIDKPSIMYFLFLIIIKGV